MKGFKVLSVGVLILVIFLNTCGQKQDKTGKWQKMAKWWQPLVEKPIVVW